MVAAMSVKLWPAPTAFTVSPRSRAAATTATTSSTLVGRARYAGVELSARLQLRHGVTGSTSRSRRHRKALPSPR